MTISQPKESYRAFRERTFGDDQFIVHDGGPNVTPFAIWNKSGSDAEKTYARRMLMQGLAEGDSMALLGLAELLDSQVLRTLQAALPHNSAEVTLEIVRFLLDHDTQADYGALKKYLIPLLACPHPLCVNAQYILSRFPDNTPSPTIQP